MWEKNNSKIFFFVCRFVIFFCFKEIQIKWGRGFFKKNGQNSDDSETVQDCHSVYYATHSHTLTRTHTQGQLLNCFRSGKEKMDSAGLNLPLRNGEQSYTHAESFCETNVFFLFFFCWRHESLYIDITRTQLNSRDEERWRGNKMSTVCFYFVEKLARLMLDKSVRGGTRQQH